MKCTPDECEYCYPWGPTIPSKTRCCKGPVDYHWREIIPWRFSTTLGSNCVIAREMERGTQEALF